RLKDGVPTGEYEDFMTGFVVNDSSVWARPVGVAVAHDGALLVSEDGNGTMWRGSYRGGPQKSLPGIAGGCFARAARGPAAAPPPSATSNSRRPMVTVIRPSRARCVKGRYHATSVESFSRSKRAETARGAVARDARGSALLELDVGRPDHLAPLLGFFA